ncbi:unnamed protein product [Vitrella brassicaformis CCMP3155]|uniref:Threonylcarbamoyl-AMP synthase n=1 Tax=Vitrella brassicaformis (strain CCMP3155) TaxID=1169540 RepID=A0A0G4GN51_VITBC|nr:unnamed protein product [Vitrella brassicaformis CCMP3155]|eukprot:CEM31626.1 unnamed protein product [Vitrella brassicaformis CCMP3155]
MKRAFDHLLLTCWILLVTHPAFSCFRPFFIAKKSTKSLPQEYRLRGLLESGPLLQQQRSALLVSMLPTDSGAEEGSDKPSSSRLIQPHQDRSSPAYRQLMAHLGARIRQGSLVSFPTETVYGLGANALDEQAVLKIFAMKRRPLTDPLICHVGGLSGEGGALALLDVGDREREVVERLAATFWPGPLSIIGKARGIVPPEVTAGTGFVAVRCPNSSLALDLISASDRPIAAPSANLFGAISPTTAQHVLKNFPQEDLVILDGGSCHVGIESTVIKLEMGEREGEDWDDRICINRRGRVSKEMIEECLRQAGAEMASIRVYVSPKIDYGRGSASEDVARAPPSASEAQESPGMLLSHYAPSVPTYLISVATTDTSSGTGIDIHPQEESPALPPPSKCVLIDMGSRMRDLRGEFAAYFDLCEAAEHTASDESAFLEEAMRSLFATLHEAEAAAVERGCGLICVGVADDASDMGEPALALYDRLYRAASGRRLHLYRSGAAGWRLRRQTAE